MSKLLVILRKVLARVAIAAAFTVFWVNVMENVMTSAPLVLFGAFYFAGAWFSYMRWDGFLLSRFVPPASDKSVARLKLLLRMDKGIRLDTDTEEPALEKKPADETGDGAGVNILSNVLSGALLIAVSFLF